MLLLVNAIGLPCSSSSGAPGVADWQHLEKRCQQAAAIEDHLRETGPPSTHTKEQQLQELRTRSRQALQRWQSSASRDKIPELPHEASTLSQTPSKPPNKALADDFFRYYEARLELLAGHTESARTSMAQLANSPAVAPEAVVGFFDANSWTTREQSQLRFKTLHQLIPTRYGSTATVVEFRYLDLHAMLRPAIPRVNPYINLHNPWIEVADDLLKVGLYREAAAAYREAIYTCGSSSWRLEYDAWLSPATAPLWFKLALCEWQAGDTSLLADDLAKAYVFGNPVTRTQAELLFKAIGHTLSTPDAPADPYAKAEHPEVTEPDWDEMSSALLLSICGSYRDILLTPRGIELLRRYGSRLHDRSKQRAKALEVELMYQWLDEVSNYCGNVQGKCYLMGHDVTLGEQRYFVVPTINNPAALEEAGNVVNALLNPLPSNIENKK